METIILDYPVTVDGARIAELNMRRPNVGDQLAVDNSSSPALKEINLFANLTEQSPEVIKKLDMADYSYMQEVYEGFLSRSKSKS